jgi:hypothetical protein
VPDKENAKHFTGTKKCGGRKLHKGQSPTVIFWNPSRRTGGVAVTVCYTMVASFYLFLKQ